MRSPCGRCTMFRVPDAGSAALIERLNNLHEGPLVLPDVIRLGDAAVPGLEAILRGPSQALPHARCMAADALGAIGGPKAASALVGALRDSIARTPDVISLEAERVVIDRIANHLCAHRENDVIEALLEALRITPYPACARALGELRDPRAIPLLIECLHDDAARGAALDALRRFGRDACPALIGTLIRPRLRRGLEAPSSIDARVAAARLLGELAQVALAPSAADVALRTALTDRQRAVRIEAAIAIARRGWKAAPEATATLAGGLDEAHWVQAERIMDALARFGPAAEETVVPLIALPVDDEGSRRRKIRAAIVAGRLRASSAIVPLAALAQIGDRELRLAVITALARIPATACSVLERFLLDREGPIRLRAVRALRDRRALGPALATELLGDSDPEVRILARASLLSNSPAAEFSLVRTLLTLGSRPRMAGIRIAQRISAPLRGRSWIKGVRSRARLWWGAWECLIAVRCRAPPRRGWTLRG